MSFIAFALTKSVHCSAAACSGDTSFDPLLVHSSSLLDSTVCDGAEDGEAGGDAGGVDGAGDNGDDDFAAEDSQCSATAACFGGDSSLFSTSPPPSPPSSFDPLVRFLLDSMVCCDEEDDEDDDVEDSSSFLLDSVGGVIFGLLRQRTLLDGPWRVTDAAASPLRQDSAIAGCLSSASTSVASATLCAVTMPVFYH